jgi:hypothetical protein
MFRSQRRKLFRDKDVSPKTNSQGKRRSLIGRPWHRIATSVSTLPGTGLRLQAKLTIGAKNDQYEQEADRVADQVMRMPDSDSREVAANQKLSPSSLPRQCAECEEEIRRQPMEEEEETLQMQPLEEEEGTLQMQPLEEEEEAFQRQPLEEEEEETLQMKSSTRGVPHASAGAAPRKLLGSGTPLPGQTRAYFEPRFGQSFRGVHVHTGTAAQEATRMVGARAFTVGRHIVFNQGQYAPETETGKRLLAHELMHTLQQGKGRSGEKIQRLRQDFPVVGPLSHFGSITTAVGSLVGRPLSRRELRVLWPVFGPHVNYFAVRICEAGICSPDRIPRTIGNIIGTPSGFSDDTLIHECAHVWQHQNGIPFGYAVDALTAQGISWLVTGSRLGAYNYRFLERYHIPWRFWNAEQQASWIEDNKRLPNYLVWGISRGMMPPF